MSIRVLIITQWFDPEPTFKGIVFARELVKQGFEVEVLTGFPNYPGGKLYPGYKLKFLQREHIDGVDILRVPLYPSHDHGAIGRVLNYLSFAATSLVYGLFAAKKPDVIYAYHPPLTVGIAAAIVRFFRRAPMVYDIQDMWPDTLSATGMISNKTALRIIAKVCDWMYRRADQLVVLSPGFKRLLIDRGVPASKIEVIYNWCAEDSVSSSFQQIPEEFPDEGRFKILFAGNMGKAQALYSVLDAAEILQERRYEIVFIFLGGGVDVLNLKSSATAKKLNNVYFLPSVPMEKVGAYLAVADVLLVHLKNDPLFSITIPSKTQAYMAAGKPILMAVNGDASDLVKESECGKVSEPENAASLADAAIDFMEASSLQREAMARNGKRYYQEKMALSVGVQKFGKIFQSLAK